MGEPAEGAPIVAMCTTACHHERAELSTIFLQGLGRMELDNLRDWEAKFNFKYPIVGSLVKA